MNINLKFVSVNGIINMPASKSMMQRICAAALLHKGTTTISNFGISNDDKAAINIIENLGAIVAFEDEKMIVKSDGNIKTSDKINCGESGLSARLFTPIAALSKYAVTITGSGSLANRPMHFFKESLQQLGVQMPDFSGFIPFIIQGPLKPKNIIVDGSLSSQFISGLLFAFSAAASEKITVLADDLVSKPYLDLSLEILEHFGKKITNKNYTHFEIDPSLFTNKKEIEITVEGDWSSAAFWIAAAAINGSVLLKNLNKYSKQADRKMLEIVSAAGAQVEWKNEDLFIESKTLNAFETDLTHCPDLFPVLAIFAACCNGQSKLVGLHRLTHKESNRTESIVALLGLLQVTFAVKGDAFIINGKSSFPVVAYTVPNDHRMAMAAALAVFNCEGEMKISHAECVQKSYPQFWEDVQKHCN